MKDEEEGKVRHEGGRQRRRGRRKGKMYSGREKEQGRLGKGGGRRVAGSSQRALKEKRESFCHANQMAKQSVRKDFHPMLQKTRINFRAKDHMLVLHSSADKKLECSQWDDNFSDLGLRNMKPKRPKVCGL